MNLTTLEKSKTSDISVDALVEYIQKKGWQEIHQLNQKLIVFQGKTDSLGKPIRMVLPVNDQLCDSPIMLDKALNLLAAIENRTKREVVTEVMTGHKNIDNGLADYLSSLRFQYEQALSEADKKASQYREQLSHVNALLLDQLAPSNGATSLTAPENPKTSAFDVVQPKYLAQVTTPLSKSSKVSDRKHKAESKPTQAAKRKQAPAKAPKVAIQSKKGS